MKFFSYLVVSVLIFSVTARGQLISAVGEHLSEGGAARVVVRSVGDVLKLRFIVQNESQRRASMEVNLDPSTGWFAYMEGEDSVWVYRGADTILHCKAVLSEVESQYVFDKRMYKVPVEFSEIPVEIRKCIIDHWLK